MEEYRVKTKCCEVYFGLREKKARGCRKIYKVNVHNLHSSTGIMNEID
jgi:hypothetical protein